MPLFCICSGLFAKFKMKHLIRYFIIYVIGQSGFALLRAFTPWETPSVKTMVFPFFIMWYIYSLILWICITVIIDKLVCIHKNMKMIIMLLTLFVALAMGKIDISGIVGTNRVVSFAPLFLLAYIFKSDLLRLVSFLSVVIKKIWLLLLVILVFIIMLMENSRVNINAFYNDLPYLIGGYNWKDRFMFYMGGTIMTICIWVYFSKAKISCLVPYIGKHTMQIYISHGFLYYIIKHTLYKNIDSLRTKCLVGLICSIICVVVPTVVTFWAKKKLIKNERM